MTEYFKTSILNLRSNLHFLVWECERRGISAELLDPSLEVVLLSFGTHKEYIVDIYSRMMSVPCNAIVGNKSLLKKILEKEGFLVIPGDEFWDGQNDYVHELADYYEFPVVLKPSVGSNGTNVFLNVESHSEVERIYNILINSKTSPSFLIERQIAGEDLKLFVTRRGAYAALRRTLPSILGDGSSSIKQLIERENSLRLGEVGIRRLAPIPIDWETEHHLAIQGRKIDDILELGMTITVRGNANVGTGAISVDCTEQLPKCLLKTALKVFDVFPALPYAAIDFIVPNLEDATAENSYICEINTLPSLGIHMAPAIGLGQNVAAMIIDMLFPESPSPSSYSFKLVG